LQRGAADRTGGSRQPDEQRVPGLDVAALKRVEDRPGGSRDPDRAERGRRGCVRREAGNQDQERNGDDAAADAEEGAEEAGDQADRDKSSVQSDAPPIWCDRGCVARTQGAAIAALWPRLRTPPRAAERARAALAFT
jgi:hypothetical protein